MSLKKVNQILMCLKSKGGLSASDIARETDIPRSSVDRDLHHLCEVGWIWRRSSDRAFFLTSELSHFTNKEVVERGCGDIADKVYDFAKSHTLKYSFALSKDISPPTILDSTIHSRGIGVTLPLFGNSMSTAILSIMPPDILLKTVKEMMTSGPLKSEDNENVQTDYLLLLEDIKAIRQNEAYFEKNIFVTFPYRVSETIFTAIQIQSPKKLTKDQLQKLYQGAKNSLTKRDIS